MNTQGIRISDDELKGGRNFSPRSVNVLFRDAFQKALSMDKYLERHGSNGDRSKWAAVYDAVELTSEQLATLSKFTRRMPILCMSGAWCGDCARQCPIVDRIASASPLMELRFIDRETDPELAAELQVCGAARVPQVVWLNEYHEPVLRAGDKTASQYRELRDRMAGASCSTGIVASGDSRSQKIQQEWVDLFEWAQLILQTSPKLTQRHVSG